MSPAGEALSCGELRSDAVGDAGVGGPCADAILTGDPDCGRLLTVALRETLVSLVLGAARDALAGVPLAWYAH